MDAYTTLCEELRGRPRTWLVTGAAGFIGSHLVERLLRLGQRVTGLDNFATGHRHNLDDVCRQVGEEAWSRFNLIEGDIRDARACAQACEGASIVLHEAALGSIPRSLAQPLATHETNVTGLVNMLIAARDAKVDRFVYASSSSIYGDDPNPVRCEEVLGRPLSPYAASKRAGEIYAVAFGNSFGIQAVGLRYFNVFGPRQDPDGAYAAVIPRWAAALLRGEPVEINGDGQTSRDFCHVDNVVQANLLAATTHVDAPELFNVGTGVRTSLNELFAAMQEAASGLTPGAARTLPVYRDFRAGDVRHAVADISLAKAALGYEPKVDLRNGLRGVFSGLAQQSNCAGAQAREP